MLPPQTTLQALLDYDPVTGLLRWKQRPRSMFNCDRLFNSWNTRYANQIAFTAVDRKGYNVGAILGVNYRASRVIFKLITNIEPNQVDHEDGSTLNNSWVNLRNVTGQQNQMNMKRGSNNTSGTTGVSWNTAKNKWDAVIRHKRKVIRLGRFVDKQDAIDARKAAEKQYGYHPNHGR